MTEELIPQNVIDAFTELVDDGPLSEDAAIVETTERESDTIVWVVLDHMFNEALRYFMESDIGPVGIIDRHGDFTGSEPIDIAVGYNAPTDDAPGHWYRFGFNNVENLTA